MISFYTKRFRRFILSMSSDQPDQTAHLPVLLQQSLPVILPLDQSLVPTYGFVRNGTGGVHYKPSPEEITRQCQIIREVGWTDRHGVYHEPWSAAEQYFRQHGHSNGAGFGHGNGGGYGGATAHSWPGAKG